MRFNLTVSTSSPLVSHSSVKGESVAGSHQTSTSGALELSFAFSGTGVWAYGGNDGSESSRPFAYSILDDNIITTLTNDLNAYNSSHRKLLFGASDLDPTTHNLLLAIQDPSVTVDYIDFETIVGGDDTYAETLGHNRIQAEAIVTNPATRSVDGFNSVLSLGRYCFIGEAVALYGTPPPLVPFAFVLDGGVSQAVHAPRDYAPSRLSPSELLYFSSGIDPGPHCLEFYVDRDPFRAPRGPAPVETFLIIDRVDVYRTPASDETLSVLTRRSSPPSSNRSLALLTAPPIILGLVFIMLAYTLCRRSTKRRAAMKEREDEVKARPYPLFETLEEPRIGSSGWYSSPRGSGSVRNLLSALSTRRSAKETVDLCAGCYCDQKHSGTYWDDSKSSSFGPTSDKELEAQGLTIPSSPDTLEPAFVQTPRTARSMTGDLDSSPFQLHSPRRDGYSPSGLSTIPPLILSTSSPTSPTRIRPLPELPRARPLPQPQRRPVIPNRLGENIPDYVQWGSIRSPRDLQVAVAVEDSPPPYCMTLQRILV